MQESGKKLATNFYFEVITCKTKANEPNSAINALNFSKDNSEEHALTFKQREFLVIRARVTYHRISNDKFKNKTLLLLHMMEYLVHLEKQKTIP